MTPSSTIYSRFHHQAAGHPDALAVAEDGRTATFAELDLLSARVAAALAAGSDAPAVGIVMTHGIEMIAAMLGVLRTGAAYVPAEPSLPADRISYMMKTAGVKTVIDDDFFRSLPAEVSPQVVADRSTPGSLAYILYTSGTTGRPKG